MKSNSRKAKTAGMTRAERGAHTRKQLLEATIECLAERGYARMSTNDVVRKTGVSRGALAHHFPSKSHLVAEAAAYLIKKRITYTAAKFRALGEAGHDTRTELETKWKAYEKWFPANIEFMVAFRADPELRELFGRTMERYEKELSEIQTDTSRHERVVQYVTGCFIRGLCLERLVNPDELVDQIFDRFVQIMDAAFPPPSSGR